MSPNYKTVKLPSNFFQIGLLGEPSVIQSVVTESDNFWSLKNPTPIELRVSIRKVLHSHSGNLEAGNVGASTFGLGVKPPIMQDLGWKKWG